MKERQTPWVSALLFWFARNKRSMPWRGSPSPYAVWVSEIMLQQTQVDTVMPYFRRFMRQFPSIKALAEADLQDVLKAWEGLGYYARARNLKLAAEQVRAEHGGRLPRTALLLARLPGIGEYTAAAVASICFGEAVPTVDGNVARVVARLKGMALDITRQAARRCLADELVPVVPGDAPGDFNEAMMELGALVCRPRQPTCADCPLRRWCVAYRDGAVARLPAKPSRKPVPHHDMVAAVIVREGDVLVCRRPEAGLLGGLWEFPGGRRKPRESFAAALRRCVQEQTGLSLSAGKKLTVVKHAYSHFRITIRVLEAACLPVLPGRQLPPGISWVPVSRLARLPFSTAHRKIADLVK